MASDHGDTRMQRRDFFKNIVARTLDVIHPKNDPAPLSENDLFTQAMRLGIDPATQAPDQLRQTVERMLKEETPPGSSPSV